MHTPTPRPRARRLAAGLLAVAGAAAAAGPADAITGGIDAPSTPQAQSTVMISSPACTGTLVAPDLVLTAGHCTKHTEVPVAQRPHAPYRGASHGDWERPDRFYSTDLLPLGRPTITVAQDSRFDAGDPDEFQTTATEFAVPGDADMALLRLAVPVPATAAVPVPIMTALPVAVGDASRWLADAQRAYQVAGHSDGSNQSGWNLQTATVTGTRFPCAGQAAHKICSQVTSPSGALMQQGDSGGPLYLDPTGARRLAGVFQCCGPSAGAFHTVPFYRGGADTLNPRVELPNVGAWLESWVTRRSGGAAYVKSMGGAADLGYGYASNPSGLQPRIDRTATGVYHVVFEGVGNTNQPRVPLVTAHGGQGACTVTSDRDPASHWVRCFDSHGWPANRDFQLVSDYTQRDLWIRAPRVTSGSATVRTVHGDVTVTRLSAGRYRVDAPGFSGGRWRNVMVSATSDRAAACHVVSWESTPRATVRCHWRGTALDSAFSFAATVGGDSSYAWGSSRSTESYTAPSAYASTAGNDNVPTIRRLGTGYYRVSFPGLPANTGGTIQVSAYGETASRCNIDGWSSDWIGVICVNASGAAADSQFVVRGIDPVDAGRVVRIELNEIDGTSEDANGGLDLYGSMRFTAGAVGSRSIPLVDDAADRRFASPLVLTALSQPGQQFVDVRMELRDDDGSHSATDQVDIVPNQNVNDLRLRIDLVRHTVTMLDATRPITGALGAWWSDGMDGGETARVVFKALVADH